MIIESLAALVVAISPSPSNENVAKLPAVKVKEEVIKKPLVVKKTKSFVPYAKADYQQILFIADLESRKWSIDEQRLLYRIKCESTFNYLATNGQYKGLGQFGQNAWVRATNDLGTRRVEFVKEKTRKVKDYKYTHYSDGTVVKTVHKTKRQKVKTTYKGKLPTPKELQTGNGIFHTWAQVRAISRAFAGLGQVSASEWDPRC